MKKIINKLGFLKNLLAYAFNKFPLLYVSVALSFVAAAMEVAVVAALYPLTELATKGTVGRNYLIQCLEQLSISISTKNLLIVILVVLFLRISINFVFTNLSALLSKKIIGSISTDTFNVIIKKYSLQDVEKKSIGYFINLAGDEANRAGTIVASFVQTMSLAALSTMYLMAIFHYSASVGMGVVLFLAICFIGLYGIFKKLFRLGKVLQEQSRLSNSIFMDSLNGFRSIKAFSAEDYTIDNYSKKLNNYIFTLFKIDFFTHFSKSAPVLFLIFILLCVVVFLQKIPTGENLSFVITNTFLLLRFFPTVGVCLNTFNKLVSDMQVGKDVVSILNQNKVQSTNSGKIDLSEDVSSIEFQNVSFSYNGSKEVLKNISLNFQKGKRYAIVGSSGMGKSTLTDLILSFYTEFAGKILVNGIENKKISEQSLRSKIILLGQQSSISNDTIFNNINYGKNYDIQKVKEASLNVCLDEVVNELPGTFDFILAYQGTNLSGGQKQRVGLARAVLRESSVLILDESTTALDNYTKHKVLENIEKIYKDKILIFITHDHEIISRADIVYDLKKLNENHSLAST